MPGILNFSRCRHMMSGCCLREHFLAASSSDDYVLVDVHPGQVVGAGRLVDERDVERGLLPQVELGLSWKYGGGCMNLAKTTLRYSRFMQHSIYRVVHKVENKLLLTFQFEYKKFLLWRKVCKLNFARMSSVCESAEQKPENRLTWWFRRWWTKSTADS